MQIEFSAFRDARRIHKSSLVEPFRHHRFASRNLRAFSLVELLVVMAIIALIASFSTSAMRSMFMGNAQQRALTGISSAMELARQTAIAGSTYTWVALAQGKNKIGGNSVTAVIFASKDGSLDDRTKIRLVDRVQVYDNVMISNTDPEPNVANQIPTPGISFDSVSFQPKLDELPTAMRGQSFDHMIMFTPTGEAVLDNLETSLAAIPLRQALQLTVTPAKGATPNAIERKSASVVWINGITGAVEVFQPAAS